MTRTPHGTVTVGGIRIGNDQPLVLIAGPCVIESESMTERIARTLEKTARRMKVPLIFKCSYDKANRSSIKSYRGPGLEEGLEILERLKRRIDAPLLIDVHSVDEIPAAEAVADILQIPAFMCRQTDLVVAAARTGKIINVKKGQFLAPWDVRNVVDKAMSVGNRQILLTERGVSFGYNNLVVDMRGLTVMKGLGCPVIFDATHSVQLPGGRGTSTGGQREFIWPLARAAVAVGVAAVFMEVHPDPARALSDGPNAIPLSALPGGLRQLMAIDRTVKSF
ncbi:MAG TPA: 3-deoxy-8-phosphooctulonate synthase [Elusimicrobiota bacterium]|nr:3-deoxy-8-phosphooctulonate synthase [Elusimicrobiota bacterium]